MRIYVKVVSKSSRNKIEKTTEGEYKVWVTAPPVNGQANEVVIKVLAGYFKVSQSCVEIVGGKTAKIKIVDILL
ncbi:MAG: hypothetical protein COU40_00205 [Candidatus Moranbacteria bacterium CG10_big_fil_rev_8_21_14_0_10_35_21]|nr:MAG: hypothetical protein COU40_00205 [Candidatus Moranbacteria bacterium CG10_big_fil_rev_8_21_14_0_10_35_21]PJA88735.1 MAG: hypothetical protein CO139_01535 [Candidatus Moranbacteria bacterium CG_4_9_14_3_um_filter_36_9]